MGKPLNLNDQLNAISKGLLPKPLFFPTPTTQEKEHNNMEITETGRGKFIMNGKNSHSINLADTVRLFPTPRASDAEHGGPNQRDRQGNYALPGAVAHWPTPRAGNPGSRPNGKGGKILAEEVKRSVPQVSGQLNPDWVEALMGYPHGWTDINKKEVSTADIYPLAWINGTWERTIPRVVSGTNRSVRTNRLKGLGNAVVPQIPMALWLMIKDCLWE